MAQRFYTVDEARALLPSVVPVVEELREAFTELRTLHASLEAASRGASGDGHLLASAWTDGGEDRARALDQRLRGAAAQLDDWGVEVKDPSRGLIDFYSRRGGQVIYLCYLLGEPELGWWHGLHDGFAGRQPLDAAS